MITEPRAHLDSSIEITEPCPCDDEACPRLVRLVFVWPDRPWTVNAQARQRSIGGQQHYNQLTAEWRDTFRRLAAGAPAMAWCRVEVTQEVPNRSGYPDPAACVMAAKAAVDGIREAGVLVDDNPDYVRHIGFDVVITGRDALVVILEGPAA